MIFLRRLQHKFIMCINFNPCNISLVTIQVSSSPPQTSDDESDYVPESEEDSDDAASDTMEGM